MKDEAAELYGMLLETFLKLFLLINQDSGHHWFWPQIHKLHFNHPFLSLVHEKLTRHPHGSFAETQMYKIKRRVLNSSAGSLAKIKSDSV